MEIKFSEHAVQVQEGQGQGERGLRAHTPILIPFARDYIHVVTRLLGLRVLIIFGRAARLNMGAGSDPLIASRRRPRAAPRSPAQPRAAQR